MTASSRNATPGRWHFWIDRGGTFTDVVARDPEGRLITHKLLSENPDAYSDAVTQGVRDVLGLGANEPLPAHRIAEIRVGTTVGTNALLERRGEPTVLVVTGGFGDILRIGYQNRPDIFALDIRLPEMLYDRVIETHERLDAAGRVLRPLNAEKLRGQLIEAYAAGFRACAVAFLHAYKNPEHERTAGAIAREAGFPQVSLSHEVSPGIKLVRRGDTTVVDAYISPVLRRYVDLLNDAVGQGETRLWFMQSNGGLAAGEFFRGRDCLLSGPAGGVIGAAGTARAAGLERVIGFDMGGTSTDVSHYAGAYERTHESEIAGTRLQIPMLHIETVAAGGGSVLTFDGQRLRVGPRSAGANPGPACYRRDGPLTVTDANLLLGRVQPDFFPHIFGPTGDKPLDREVVIEKFRALARELETHGIRKTPERIAEGFFTIANENMARAIRKISVQKGYDLTRYALNCFGGAGGQHACAMADMLGIRRVFLHPCAGVLSAYGIGQAELRTTHVAHLETDLGADDLSERVGAARRDLENRGRTVMEAQGCPPENVRFETTALLRYSGADTHLEIALKDQPAAAIDEAAGESQTLERELRAAFARVHETRFGFAPPERAVVLKEISVEAVGRLHAEAPGPHIEATRDPVPEAIGTTRLFTGDHWHTCEVFRRETLPAGKTIAGPALITAATETVVVDPGWMANCRENGDLILERSKSEPVAHREASERSNDAGPDPILLEVFYNTFQSIAEEMGLILQSTATSVNIKERLDFSCALFDEAGNLVASAPHIPVHLGSMSDSVRAVQDQWSGAMRPGDVFVSNNPYAGGTHLPDVTVVTPFYDEGESDARNAPLFFLAARGHHADIGGVTPGSMPASSTNIAQEGVLLDSLRLVSGGRFAEAELRAALGAGPFSARDPDQNLADLRAQVAANHRGASLLRALLEERGRDQVLAYVAFVQRNAEFAVRSLIESIDGGANETKLDEGGRIRVRVEKLRDARRPLRIDFSGTSPISPGNGNAPSAVVRSAVLYVLRTLIRDAIPLNEGCLAPVELILPQDCLLRPVFPAAVVGGNVETSQIIVDALLGAFGALAASQGTMNNLTFGNERYQYYETICGGTGAGPGFAGASGVHAHMTNSRLTDPEILETRFPVQVLSFALRPGSGGAGRFPGGDGVARRLLFREAMHVSILSGRRRVAPPGIAGGGDGAPGRNWLKRAEDAKVPDFLLAKDPADEGFVALDFRDEIDVRPGDEILIETPGGGGYGQP